MSERSEVAGRHGDGLHVREWGTGNRVAVLVHGVTNDSGSWWRLGPELAVRGYRVLAPELPGHGHSPRRAAYSAEASADELVAAVPPEPELMVGHSLGGRVGVLAAGRIRPARVVWEDPAWEAVPAWAGDGYRAQKAWTIDVVEATYPRWVPEAWTAKLAALQRWDADTIAPLEEFTAHDPGPPDVPALVLTVDVNAIIGPARSERLREQGYEVRTVDGAGHNAHHDDFGGFLKACDGWF